MRVGKFFLFLFIFLILLTDRPAFSAVCDGDLTSCNNDQLELKIACLEQKKKACTEIGTSLTAEINRFNTQIYLTQLRIEETEKKIDQTQQEIETLGSRIEGLDSSLNYLTKLLLEKIVEGYKKRSISLFDFIFNTANAYDFVTGLKYLKTTQNNNQKLLIQVQQTKQNFEEQKTLREEKIKKLDDLKLLLSSQNEDLASQKVAKQKLLADTQNSEVVYQRLLEQARAEYAAIQGIIAGAGIETQIREVKKGDIIATVIPTTSCNSTGEHLHFTVLEGSSLIDPFSKLKNIDYYDESGGDTWNPGGDWDWPLSPKIYFNQGYGETSCIRSGWCRTIYPFHNGIDIAGSSLSVYAVADGTLYRGSYSVGCALPYTKILHKDSNISTLYLHTSTQ